MRKDSNAKSSSSCLRLRGAALSVLSASSSTSSSAVRSIGRTGEAFAGGGEGALRRRLGSSSASLWLAPAVGSLTAGDPGVSSCLDSLARLRKSGDSKSESSFRDERRRLSPTSMSLELSSVSPPSPPANPTIFCSEPTSSSEMKLSSLMRALRVFSFSRHTRRGSWHG